MDQILKTRALTATIFTIVVLALLYINEFTRVALFSFIGLAASYELLTMTKRSTLEKIIVLSILSILYYMSYSIDFDSQIVFIAALICCLFYGFSSYSLFKLQSTNLTRYPYLGIIYPGAASMFIIYSISKGSTHTLSVILGTIILIWLSDTFAYLVGRKIGKRKLYEVVSPKKTWEGFYGGGIAAIIGGIIISFILNEVSISFWIVIALIAWIGGTIGDLTQSALKRKADVKDSGKILPGHGGIFDRFDSLIYIIPFVYLIINYL